MLGPHLCFGRVLHVCVQKMDDAKRMLQDDPPDDEDSTS
jgi:hypothetical protein